MASSLHSDISRTYPLVVWVVMNNLPEHPRKLIARLVTDRPTDYVLVADNLNDLRAQLPAHLKRSEYQPPDPSNILEIWIA